MCLLSERVYSTKCTSATLSQSNTSFIPPYHYKLSHPPPNLTLQLFYSFFKTLVGQSVTVELKNDVSITGVLNSVDQFLNLKLDGIAVVERERHPQLWSIDRCFIRGSVVRYVHLPVKGVDVDLLQDATRRESEHQKKSK